MWRTRLERRRGEDWNPALEADALCVSLCLARERITLPLARAARRFLDAKGWFGFGYARIEDHARERFGRSGRWVRDLGALAEAAQRLPGLAEALTGEDGGRPIGRVSALLIGKAATASSLRAWVAGARSSTVRQLSAKVREARRTGRAAEPCGVPPPGWEAAQEDRSGQRSSDEEPDERVTMRFTLPLPVAAAFEETRELYHAVVGGRASLASFLEAVVAEAQGAEGIVPEVLEMTRRRASGAAREARLAAATENWAFLRRMSDHPDVFARAEQTLREIERRCGGEAARATAVDPDGQIRALVRLEDEIERRLGEVLAEMSESGVWRDLAFAGAGQYGEERLGVSRSAAEGRARLARRLRELPALRSAYETGRVGFEAACLLRRALDGVRGDAAVQDAWIEHAQGTTIKRLRDEALWLVREKAAGATVAVTGPGTSSGTCTGTCMSAETWPGSHADLSTDAARCSNTGRGGGSIDAGKVIGGADSSPGPPDPPDDDTWHRSLRRVPGDAIARLKRFGRSALGGSCPVVRLRFTLPYDLASNLWTAIRAKRRALSTLLESGDAEARDFGGDVRGSVLAAQTFSVSGFWVPEWAAVLGLLEDFVEVWDDPQRAPRRRADAIYERDGWRCSAPGCTSQKNLEEHHIVYRSRGGTDAHWNRLCLCRFHHQQGEHGEYASCHGRAPLGVTWWLGRGGAGGSWRNERRIQSH